MREIVFSEHSEKDLEEHLAHIIQKDGILRASNIYDAIIDKINEIASIQIEIGQRKANYLIGLPRIIFKGCIYLLHLSLINFEN